MTATDAKPTLSPAAEALAAHLLRVDLQLARAGLDRDERDATCRQIAEQFDDLLSVSISQATAEQADEALTKLSGDAAFDSSEVTSLGLAMRMVWSRFWIGTPTPLALNDHGHRRIVWIELIKRLGMIYLFVAVVAVIAGTFLLDPYPTPGHAVIIIFPLILPAAVVARLWRTPVQSLPRIEHWPIDHMRQHRFVGVLTMLGSFVFVVGLIPVTYLVVALIGGRAARPVDPELLLTILWVLGGLGLLVVLADSYRKRRRLALMRRWAAGSAA